MSIFSNSRLLVRGIWALAILSVAATVAVLIGAARRSGEYRAPDIPEIRDVAMDGEAVAHVDSTVLYSDDLAIAGMEPSMVDDWLEDQLLAELAVERGLENSRRSRLVQERARQVYLRDELLSRTYSMIPFPDSLEVLLFMRSDSVAYMVERHYYHILVSSRETADSVHQVLSWGENFQITAERISLGQKAGIGGDLGFMTAGELMAYGISRENAVIEGLGDVLESSYGFHIFMVDEIRALEDTARAVWSLSDDIYRDRLMAARDSLLRLAAQDRDVYLDPSFRTYAGDCLDALIDSNEGEGE